MLILLLIVINLCFVFLLLKRYYSAIIDAYCDLTVNFSRLHERNRLAFVSFCTLQCNGTLPICEITRIIMKNVDVFRVILEQEYNGCFWKLMIQIGTESNFKAVGTSTAPRCTHFTGGSVFPFDIHADFILDQFESFKRCKSDKELHDTMMKVQAAIENSVNGVGVVNSLPFLQLSALIGLIPLKVATFATVKEGGPSMILGMDDNNGNVKENFVKLHQEFSHIWGNQFTEAYLENTLCELNRTISRRCPPNHPRSIDALFKESTYYSNKRSLKKDAIVMYSHRGLKRSLQSLFHIDVDKKGNPHLCMHGHEVDIKDMNVSIQEQLILSSLNDASIHSFYAYK